MRAPSTYLLALASLAAPAASLFIAGCATVIGLDDFRVDPSLAADAGSASDAAADAASPDSSAPPDSGNVDAASPPDASNADAGPPDSGADAGQTTDAGAGSDSGVDAGLFPRVVFLEPLANGISNVGSDNLAVLSIETPGFTLRSPGECRGEPDCGHAHVTIDGTSCNNVAAGKAYNVSIFSPGPTKLNMAFCQAGPTGIKTISVELVQENHAPFPVREIGTLSTNFIRGKVRLTAPLDEDVVTLPSSNLTPLRLAISDFTLRAPGQCGALTNCGHARITIDGASCNAPGQPYNVIASTPSGTNLNLAHCTDPLGTKTVRVDLVDDTGAALNPVQSHTASVTFIR